MQLASAYGLGILKCNILLLWQVLDWSLAECRQAQISRSPISSRQRELSLLRHLEMQLRKAHTLYTNDTTFSMKSTRQYEEYTDHRIEVFHNYLQQITWQIINFSRH